MDEIIKLAIEAGGLGVGAGLGITLLYWFFKRFIKHEVLEPINELKDDSKEMRKGMIKFTDRVTGFVFDLQKGHKELEAKMAAETVKMSNLFADAIQQVAEAKTQSTLALEKAQLVMKAAEKQNETVAKMFAIAKGVHGTNEKIKTEVEALQKDMIFVKSKVSGESDET